MARILANKSAAVGTHLKSTQLRAIPLPASLSTGRIGSAISSQLGITHGLSASARDHYYALGVTPGASEQDVKTAYRRLVLRYHPDVCKEKHCVDKFLHIKQAYELISPNILNGNFGYFINEVPADSFSEGLMGVNDDTWEEWEEWMGWEGAGTRDYSSHINYSI